MDFKMYFNSGRKEMEEMDRKEDQLILSSKPSCKCGNQELLVFLVKEGTIKDNSLIWDRKRVAFYCPQCLVLLEEIEV